MGKAAKELRKPVSAKETLMGGHDGVSMQTKRKLVELGLNKPEDFGGKSPAQAEQKPAAPGGDPTRKMPMSEYEKAKAEAKRRTDEAWLRSKQKGSR